MARKLKDKHLASKGLKGSLARLKVQEQLNAKAVKNAEIEKQNQLNKQKSLTKKQRRNNAKQVAAVKGYLPFKTNDTVLLIGEGDFSFAKSLVVQNFIHPENLIATSYDSLEEAKSKYSGVEDTLTQLDNDGVRIMHDVDATDLPRTLNFNAKQRRGTERVKLFNDGRQLRYIMFNFPHTGSGIKDQDRNIKQHQELMVAFFQNCNQVFDLVNVANKKHNDFGGYNNDDEDDEYGKVLVSLFEGEPYNSWTIKALAKSKGFKVEQSGRFEWSMFPEYHHKRTNSGVKDTTKPANERDARIYKFEKNINKEKTKSVDDSDSD
ncbi:hypothetical protein KGF57_005038 [Candida theae]|uniref:25S rRNA (uridine-N(3))-methyltransferase BMT5-like domain-containing protein n=1 Tax=Candida theae TaxID=1198502 RepID=A0AAD5B9Y4_9ASCO|nr:uncharacterized protein KGF57_005038 [Candida theae]KAI5948975.1 hypothetical protein KGF57_005038 [Candida theae]